MVLRLPVDISQHSLELTRTHRKCAISALPRKPAIPGMHCFDLFGGRLLHLLDKLSLGNSAWQGGGNVNVIGIAADAHEFGTVVAADCCEISMHVWPHVCIEPGFTIFGAEDDMQNDLAE
jgi:hypothetical protein